MLELCCSVLIIAVLVWFVRKQLREAERRGFVAGSYLSAQQAAARQLRHAQHTKEDV
jgi:hypothetical protein